MSQKLKNFEAVPMAQVDVEGGFWGRRLEVNRKATLPIQYEQCKKTGRFDAWKLDWEPGKPKPHIFWDSDAGKWLEAAAYSLAKHPDKALEKQADRLIDLIAKAQQKDGYLNIFFTAVEPENRWGNLRDLHELYCAGHLMEGAVAYYAATGKRKLLDVMMRYADHIGRMFGRGKGRKRGYCGHPEVELALVKLYRATGKADYLKLAEYFVDERGRSPNYFEIEARKRGDNRVRAFDYFQAHEPVRQQKDAVGHAVRAMYLYSGMADVAAETGNRQLLAACRRLWRSVVDKRMYITGSVGSTPRGEAFTFDYDLPNEEAYAETCAAIGLVFWAHRMMQMDADGEYADVMELALFNGVLSGVSLDGRRFYYANRLAVHPEAPKYGHCTFPAGRQEWFGCACCPPNLARLLASLGEYVYSRARNEVRVHLFVNGSANVEVGGQMVALEQRTEYPWEEKVVIKVSPEKPHTFKVSVRIPAWCRQPRMKVNGRAVDLRKAVAKGYAGVSREWRKGDIIELVLPMPVERVEANPKVRQNAGRVALMRGPVVYCLEEADNGMDLNAIELKAQPAFRVTTDTRLGGAPVIRAGAVRTLCNGWDGRLYRPAGRPVGKTVTVKAVPYFMWANRRVGEMLVWIRQGR
ncbi:MAG TPA: beta-L-arabinofuranosidase domain-containing protein [Sedimentisphaerales bacterium]|nr:beta-L-arabinofuranosidase domain-containing protein [Sedimentisphaerales bacterium]